MASPRIEQLKQKLMETQPCVTAERLRLATEGYREYAGEPMLLARAKTLAYVLRHMTISIAPGELLVGSHSDKPHCAPIYPEYLSADWLLSELDKGRVSGESEGWLPADEVFDALEARYHG